MSQVFLCLGGNLGNREENLYEAITQLEKSVGNIVRRSSVYETASWGNSGQPSYLNQVIEVSTQLYPMQLLEACLHIERELGRTRNAKWENRLIDIDVLFIEDEIIEDEFLKVPHPYLHERKFVLVPLAEIAGGLVHPVFNKSINSLLFECKDNLKVTLWKTA